MSFRKPLLLLLLAVAVAILLAHDTVAVRTTTTTTTTTGRFSFIHISDIHIGARGAEANFRSAVAKINEIVAKRSDVRFAIVTGDMTHSMMPNQLQIFKNIMDQIAVPYIPMLGNHDIWMYNSTWEESIPTGDLMFGEVYLDHFRALRDKHGLSIDFVDTRCKNIERGGIESLFLNFELRVNSDLSILGLDWCSRKPAVKWLGYKGSWPGADLHEFPCGTMDWLKRKLQEISNRRPRAPKRIIIAQHHPFRAPYPIPSAIYAFSGTQKKAIRNVLAKYMPIDTYWGIVAGHFHRWFEGKAFDEEEWESHEQFEAMASLTDGSFALVSIADNGYNVERIERFTP